MDVSLLAIKSSFWNIVLLLVSWHLERSVSVACMLRDRLCDSNDDELHGTRRQDRLMINGGEGRT